MNTSHTHLTALIERVLGNSQIDLVITEDGYDWLPRDNRWTTEYLSLLDQEGLLSAWQVDGEPDAGGLAEWVQDNVREWIRGAISTEIQEHEPSDERIAFLNGLLENI